MSVIGKSIETESRFVVVGWVCAEGGSVRCLPGLKGVFGVGEIVWDLIVARVVSLFE